MTKEKSRSKVVFVRHAHREKPIPEADNGLSSKGLSQVEELVKDYKKKSLPRASHFWSSPKKRCVETLAPLCSAAEAPIKIEILLDEQSHSESRTKFQERIQSLISKIGEINETLYLCSHGDVIPEAVELMTGKSVDVSKGQALILERNDEDWELL